MTLIKKKINILKKTMLYIPYNKRFIFKINIDNSIVIMRKYKKQVYIKNIIDLYKEINIIEFLKKNQKDVKYFKLDNSSIKAKFLKYNIEFIMTISKSFL